MHDCRAGRGIVEADARRGSDLRVPHVDVTMMSQSGQEDDEDRILPDILLHLVQRGLVTPPRRAAEKVVSLLRYSGVGVWRTLSLCRCRAVFPCAAGVAAALGDLRACGPGNMSRLDGDLGIDGRVSGM